MSTKTKFWTEELIRDELRKLDVKVRKKTEYVLEGATIPIVFNNAHHTLGYFSTEKPEFKFCFSRYYFDDPNFPEASAIDVIRHEYAHYYTYVVFGRGGHDKYWKASCCVVGAIPQRLHSNEMDERNRQIEERNNRIYSNLLEVGATIIHKRYGKGTIQEIELHRDVAVETIHFESGLIKKLVESWILENCEIIDKKGSQHTI